MSGPFFMDEVPPREQRNLLTRAEDGGRIYLAKGKLTMLKIIWASVAFAALCLKVIGEALAKNWSTMKPGRPFDPEEKKKRRALWANRGRIFTKVSTALLLIVAGWAVASAFMKNSDMSIVWAGKIQIANILAILASPVIAVRVSVWLQNRKEKRHMRMFIFSSLMSTRHQVAQTDEIVRALNMIDVVFCDQKKIRSLWREYLDMLSDTALNNPTGWGLQNVKRKELIAEMAKVVGYEKEITLKDIERVYSPLGLFEEAMRTGALQAELLRVLKETKGLQVVPRDETKESPAPSEGKK
jgi:hypothetical protein